MPDPIVKASVFYSSTSHFDYQKILAKFALYMSCVRLLMLSAHASIVDFINSSHNG